MFIQKVVWSAAGCPAGPDHRETENPPFHVKSHRAIRFVSHTYSYSVQNQKVIEQDRCTSVYARSNKTDLTDG